jgi:hypothetical protein
MEYETLMGLTFVLFVIILAIGLMPSSSERERLRPRPRSGIAKVA